MVQSPLIDRIKEAQKQSAFLPKMRARAESGETSSFSIHEDGSLRMLDGVCVPEDSEIVEELMQEAYSSPFSVHPGATKMYKDLKQNFWWRGTKKAVAEFVAKCLVCQQVKAEHQRLVGLL